MTLSKLLSISCRLGISFFFYGHPTATTTGRTSSPENFAWSVTRRTLIFYVYDDSSSTAASSASSRLSIHSSFLLCIKAVAVTCHWELSPTLACSREGYGIGDTGFMSAFTHISTTMITVHTLWHASSSWAMSPRYEGTSSYFIVLYISIVLKIYSHRYTVINSLSFFSKLKFWRLLYQHFFYLINIFLTSFLCYFTKIFPYIIPYGKI